jgi:DNA-binding CsgD family transcriptional regulator
VPRFDVRDVLAEAAVSADAAAFRQSVLGRLAKHVGADSGIFLRVSSVGVSAPAFLNKEGFKHLLQRYSAEPERHRAFKEQSQRALTVGGGAYLDSEVFSQRDRGRIPFYVDVIEPQKITSQIVLGLTFRGQLRGQIFLCRHGRGRAFGARQIALVAPLVEALSVAQTAAEASAPEPSVPLEQLTPRQLAVVRWVAGGLTNPEISVVLGCSVNTVRNHLAAVFQTLGVRSRTQVALWAERTFLS